MAQNFQQNKKKKYSLVPHEYFIISINMRAFCFLIFHKEL